MQASFSIPDVSNFLAEAVPYENIRRYLFEAGIPEVNIHLPASRRKAWLNVVSEAHKLGKVIALLEAIKEEYQLGSIFDQIEDFQRAYHQEYPSQRPSQEKVSSSVQDSEELIKEIFLKLTNRQLQEAGELMLRLVGQEERLQSLESEVLALQGRANELLKQERGGGLQGVVYESEELKLNQAFGDLLQGINKELGLNEGPAFNASSLPFPLPYPVSSPQARLQQIRVVMSMYGDLEKAIKELGSSVNSSEELGRFQEAFIPLEGQYDDWERDRSSNTYLESDIQQRKDQLQEAFQSLIAQIEAQL